MKTASLNKTPLYDIYKAHQGRVVEFGEWLLPVQFSGTINEVKMVRKSVGVFDVSHMGEIEVRGSAALKNVSRWITNDAGGMAAFDVIYTTVCKENGGILDDLLCYKIAPDHFFFCVNAANVNKIFNWFKDHVSGDCQVQNKSAEYAQLAIQGPRSEELLQKIVDTPLSRIMYYHFALGRVNQIEAIISRTGYTGEDGFEVYLPAQYGLDVWQKLFSFSSDDLPIVPCGLGARDILRLEMKYCLYGNDITEETNPLEAGLGWVVKLNQADFIGKDALIALKNQGVARKLIGFILVDPGIPRHGYKIFHNEQEVGVVTSGNKSPTLDIPIGMGYVPAELAKIGTKIEIEIRNKRALAEIVKTPFVRK